MQWVKQLLKPPIFEGDEDKTLVASSLHTILLTALVVSALALIVFSIIAPASMMRVAVTDLPVVVILLISWALVRSGRVRLASYLVVCVAWAAATLSAVLAGGVKAPLFGLGSMVVVLLAGFLFGPRGSLSMAIVNILTGILIAWGSRLGWVPKMPASVTYTTVLISYAMNLFAAAGTMYVAIRALQKALKRVQVELADRKQAEVEREKFISELETKNAELERFVYTVSHDLKSPLVTINGFLGYLEKDMAIGNTARVKTDLMRITDATDKMQRLLGELLELSRIGRMMNSPQDVSFGEIVREAVALVGGQIEARGVEVRIAPDLPQIHGDRARLVEVVQNLLDNAVKFMGEQSKPCIEIGKRDADEHGSPIFFIRDNGIGIEPQYHEKVFGLFNKLDSRTEGTGVGLALVKRIVEVHGGRIWIESGGAGRGATFCFIITPKP
jgi:signal transduction histidine kinase